MEKKVPVNAPESPKLPRTAFRVPVKRTTRLKKILALRQHRHQEHTVLRPQNAPDEDFAFTPIHALGSKCEGFKKRKAENDVFGRSNPPFCQQAKDRPQLVA
ncbi:MAG TPA: hypothetical protein VFQ72_02340 [Candidatus Paceibacterota bacterium]|nr:hypothetical protein [Candidatus Paceibacterota bacterium]